MDSILALLLSEPAWVVYAVVGVVVLLEGASPAGLFLPGEAAALVGGASVAVGRTDLVPMAVVVAAAAIVGDGIGFRVGQATGVRLIRSRLLHSRRPRLEALQDRLARRGPTALVLARWTAFVRTVAPALAGASGMPYRRFLRWNAVGASTWGLASVTAGVLAGQSYAEVQGWLGAGGAAVVAVALAAVAVVGLHRRRVTAPRVPAARDVVLAA